ncbi:MAG: RNA polymerase sigma factor [Hyphomonadaceae bacterium]
MPRDTRGYTGLQRAFVDRRRSLTGIARRAGSQEAEDVVQDAFLKVVETSQKEEIRSPDRLLSRVVRCVAIDRLRRRKTRPAAVSVDVGETVVDPGADPERALIGTQRLKRVMLIIDQMPPRRREVFLLHRIEEATYPQIARRMGISIKAVEKHIHLALKQLAENDD